MPNMGNYICFISSFYTKQEDIDILSVLNIFIGKLLMRVDLHGLNDLATYY